MIKSVLNHMTPTRVQSVAAGLMMGVLMTTGNPAEAAYYRTMHRDAEWDRHVVAARHYWHGPHHHPVVVERDVYAPPVVYEPPPVVEEPAGINLVVPLNFH